MGCCPSGPALPPDASEEEKVITKREWELGYGKHAAGRIIAVVLSNSTSGKVSPNQFNTIAAELKLTQTDIDTIGSPIHVVYDRISEKSRYDVVKLGAFGVLLGRGEEKGEYLFDCAGKKDQALGEEDVRGLFEAVFTISGEVLPLLARVAEGETGAPGASFDHTFIQNYINKLKGGKDALVVRCTNAVMRSRSTVTKEDFVRVFATDDNLKALNSPYAVRTALKKEAPASTSTGVQKAFSLFGKGLLGAKK